MKLSRFFFLLLFLFLFIPSVNYAQNAPKPKLGSGTVSGKIEKNMSCVDTPGGICVRAGKYMLDLTTKGSPSTVIIGDKNLLTKGRSVKVSYNNLKDSEMDYGEYFTGHAKRIVILTNDSSLSKKNLVKKRPNK